MLQRVRWCAGAGLLVACAAGSGAQRLQPSTSGAQPIELQGDSSAPGAAAATDHAAGGERDDAAGQTPEALSDSPPVTPSSSVATSASAAPAVDNNSPPTADAGSLALPRGTTVLHVGDSFAGALGPELNRALGEQGVRGVLKQEKATYIPTWASRKELSGYLTQYKPDLVLITLGGNELGIVRPEERAETVQRLVKRFEGTPCVWIGIPLWKDANPTLLEVIRNNVAPCRYFDSNALVPNLERAKDQIHPSLSARKIWANAVVRWLAEQRAPQPDKPWALK